MVFCVQHKAHEKNNNSGLIKTSPAYRPWPKAYKTNLQYNSILLLYFLITTRKHITEYIHFNHINKTIKHYFMIIYCVKLYTVLVPNLTLHTQV